jgi:hypothetical protein
MMQYRRPGRFANGAGGHDTDMAHTLAAMRGSSRWTAECSCGWRSIPAWRRQDADTRWRIHVGERHAASCILAALQARSVTAARMLELTELRSAARSRRLALREERWNLRSYHPDGPRRSRVLHTTEPTPWQLLNRARSFLGVSVSSLWLEYFTWGGIASYEEFGEMLTGVRKMPMHDYDVTAGVLNESFRDVGLGSPIADSAGVLQEPLVGIHL